MSFQPDNLNEVRSRGREPLVVSLWTYWTTTDSTADVSADDYWGASGRLTPKDIIDCVCSDGHVRLKIDAIDSSEGTSEVTKINRSALTSVTLTPGTRPFGDPDYGFITGLTIPESPNVNWVAGTYDITDAISDSLGSPFYGPCIATASVTVDGSGNAVVTVTIPGTDGGYQNGSAALDGGIIVGSTLGGVDEVDDFTLTVAAVDTDLREIDLTKDINFVPYGWYHVEDGVEGQELFIAAADSLPGTRTGGVNLWFDHVRVRTGAGSVVSTNDHYLKLFDDGSGGKIILFMFLDGVWYFTDSRTQYTFE